MKRRGFLVVVMCATLFAACTKTPSLPSNASPTSTPSTSPANTALPEGDNHAAPIPNAALPRPSIVPTPSPAAVTPNPSAEPQNEVPPSPVPSVSPRRDIEGKDEGTIAYDFTAADKQGEMVTLSGLRGKPTVLCIWGSWTDERGDRQLETLQTLFDTYGRRVNFMAVNATDMEKNKSVEEVAKYVEQKGYTLPVYYDREGRIRGMYGVTALVPKIAIIDSEGVISKISDTALDIESLEKYIKDVLGL